MLHLGNSSYITKPAENDVLFGRGGRINDHPGNVQFRTIVEQYKHEYTQLRSKRDKRRIALEVIDQIRCLGGKFLERDSSGRWFEQNKVKVFKKTSQALREGAPHLRQPSVGIDENVKTNSTLLRNNKKRSTPTLSKPSNADYTELCNTISWDTDIDELLDTFAGRESDVSNHGTRQQFTFKQRQSFQRLHSLALSDIEDTEEMRNSYLFNTAVNPFEDECDDIAFCVNDSSTKTFEKSANVIEI